MELIGSTLELQKWGGYVWTATSGQQLAWFVGTSRKAGQVSCGAVMCVTSHWSDSFECYPQMLVWRMTFRQKISENLLWFIKKRIAFGTLLQLEGKKKHLWGNNIKLYGHHLSKQKIIQNRACSPVLALSAGNSFLWVFFPTEFGPWHLSSIALTKSKTIPCIYKYSLRNYGKYVGYAENNNWELKKIDYNN